MRCSINQLKTWGTWIRSNWDHMIHIDPYHPRGKKLHVAGQIHKLKPPSILYRYLYMYIYITLYKICIHIYIYRALCHIITVPMKSCSNRCYWSPCLMGNQRFFTIPKLWPQHGPRWCLLRQIGCGVFQVARSLRGQPQWDQELEEFLSDTLW